LKTNQEATELFPQVPRANAAQSPPAVFLINSLGIGGAERAVAATTARLRQLGRDVRILCLEHLESGSPSSNVCRVEYLSSLKTSSGFVLKFLALPILAIRLSRFVARSGIPVVMSHLFRANYVNVLARLLSSSRHRVILVNHTRVSRLFKEGIPGRISWTLCKLLYPKADLIGSVSSGAARECAQMLGLPDRKSITLYDPIGISALVRAQKRPIGPGAIAAIGRMVPLKRFQDLIEAFSRIALDYPDIELHFAGDGPQRPELENVAVALGISSRIRFLGLLVEPMAALAGCDIFVSTSATEGFGMTIVEALAAGIPVIASDCAYGPREILAPGTDPMVLLEQGSDMELAQFGVLYPVGSVDVLAKALRQLLSDSNLRRDLATRGPARAADFSVESSTSAYEKLLFA
jgi:N-acetylgalactosamine-N,N'-diacetylbacillosaminyl-diphospho-undecaprenol 4-alpha-N-acetylgalactosaminyltransferase